MNSARSKRSKARPGFARSDWHGRVESAFVAYWSAMKKNRALSRIKNEEEADKKFHEWFSELAAASRALDEARGRIKDSLAAKIHQAVFQPLDLEGPIGAQLPLTGHEHEETIIYAQNPESSAIFRQMVFLKYGVTFRELIRQIDIEKNPKAQRKLMAVHRDFWRLQSGIRFEDLKLKFSYKHFKITVDGVDFGLDVLTHDELADCLDEICPCGQKHSPEYFKKLRTRIKQACNRLL
jgi:hypothetical protein